MPPDDPIHILIIDDEDMVRLNLVDYLEDEGYRVMAVCSGESALALLRTRPYDTAIVDMRLPGMDGNSFIGEAHRLQPHLRYLIHTGSTTYALPPELQSLGITKDHIFFKPIHDMDTLVEAIENLTKENQHV
ncbi:response regulator [candidate division KSB3 bacterium]|uniref:Response regulator n=1 Tax=candidate division KSB3 bacterium TaxID=2044937 RepID=A0A9D5JWZ5_9BACT|nr:response regulator [candidate division KSB3 bacterium]MBD3325506.1 response regulator [candidate division KSB3 bacterium]